MTDDDEDEYGNPLVEDAVSFVGPCTCEHTPEQHSWGCCAVEGCECEAGWEE